MRDVYNLTLDEIKEELKLLTDVDNGTGFLHFCQNYSTISHPSRGAVVLGDNMYGWQKKAAVDFLKHNQIIYKKTRQIAASTISGLYMLWRSLLFEGQNCVIVSLTQRDSSEFLRRLKYSYDYLPAWLKQKTSEFAKTTVVFEHNGSKITAIPNTENPARGGSLSLLIVDEYAFFKNQKALMGAAMPALSAGLLTEFSNYALPSQLFVISTLPHNPIDSEYLRLLHHAQSYPEESSFHLIDVDVSDIPEYQSERWHTTMREALGERNYAIEILGQEVYEVENSLLGANALEKLTEKPPIRCDYLLPDDIDEEGYYKDHGAMLHFRDEVDLRYNYIKGFWVWEDALPNNEYILICDVSSGRANDKSAIQVFKLSSMTQVAEYQGRPDLEQFKSIIETVAGYYNAAKLSIERTGIGQGIVDYFAETLQYENLYYHQKSKHHFLPGFPMTSKTRDQAIAYFASYMGSGEIHLNGIRTINEVRAFGYKPNGRIEGLGANDDLVMCLVQLAFLMKMGFALPESRIQENLVFGQLLETDVDEQEVTAPNATLKYWEQKFDTYIELDEESEMLLKEAESMGGSVVFEENQ